MKNNYDIWIMNHPDREVHPSLMKAINEQLLNDYENKVEIYQEISEIGNKKILINMVREYLNSGKTDWFLMFQDDVITGKNMFKAYDYLLEKNLKENLFVFYSARKEIHSKPFGLHKTIGNMSMYVYSILMSKWLCEKILEHADDPNLDQKHDDRFLGGLTKKLNIEFVVTNPAFVQHDLEIKSVLGHPKTKFRQSPNFDANRDLLDLVKKWF